MNMDDALKKIHITAASSPGEFDNEPDIIGALHKRQLETRNAISKQFTNAGIDPNTLSTVNKIVHYPEYVYNEKGTIGLSRQADSSLHVSKLAKKDTIRHEIGHHVLGHGEDDHLKQLTYGDLGKQEAEADAFAKNNQIDESSYHHAVLEHFLNNTCKKEAHGTWSDSGLSQLGEAYYKRTQELNPKLATKLMRHSLLMRSNIDQEQK